MIDKRADKQTVVRASRDVARLFFGDLSKEEQARLSARRGESAEYWENFEQTAQLLADLEPLADDPQLLAAVSGYATKNTPKTGLGRGWLGLAVAATLLLGVALAAWQLLQPAPQGHNVLRYVTRIGEQKSITLQDGSVVTLNTGTQLLVDISAHNREVILERGEAYFAVAKHPDRPFTVMVDSRAVTVLGTEFNLFKTPEKLVLAVIEGVVALHGREEEVSPIASRLQASTGQRVHLPSKGQHLVAAGMVAEIDERNQELIAYAPDNLQRLHSWRSGVLRFDAAPLADVIQELNRYSAKKILIEDATIMDLRVFATIRVGSPSMALTALERLLPIRVIQHFDRTVIVGRDGK